MELSEEILKIRKEHNLTFALLLGRQLHYVHATEDSVRSRTEVLREYAVPMQSACL